MKREDHCKECLEKMGSDWEVVHIWLDDYAGLYWPSMCHRVHRHHRAGIEEIRAKWGDEAVVAAIMHIKSDFKDFPEYEGEVPTKKWVENQFGIESDDEKPWE